MDPGEKRHLFTLAGRDVLAVNMEAEHVPHALLHMLNRMNDQPAYVLGRRWDVLAWNTAAEHVFGDFATLIGDERNIIHMMFANPTHRRLLVDWEILAPLALAMFRADSARYVGDPDFKRLITRLQAVSSEFRAWWKLHDVLHQPSTVKRILHPQAGMLHFEYMSLEVGAQPGLRLVVCTPIEAQADSSIPRS